MVTTLPPVRGAAFTFEIALVNQSDTDTFVATPTLVAGDIQVSKDGGQFANLATFPPSVIDLAAGADSGVLAVVLTATEMTADRVTVVFHDAAGNEWQDAVVTIYTAAQTLDATDVIADDVKGIVGHADYGNAKLVRSTTPANTLTVDTSHRALSDVASILGEAVTGTAAWLAAAFSKFFNKQTPTGTVNSLPDAVAGASGGVAIVGSAMALTGAYDAAKTAAQAGALATVDGLVDTLIARLTALRAGYLDNLAGGDTLETLSEQLDVLGGGAGTKTWTVTVRDSGGEAIDGAEVDVTTTSAHTNPVATGVTDAFGKVVLHVDPGVYYLWVQHARYNGTNPTVVTVA